VVPKVSSVALLVNPSNSNAKPQIDDTRQAASTLGVQVDVLSASSSDDINAAFAALVRQRAGGLVVSADIFISQREQLITLAAQHAVPAIYYTREFTEDGGLMSYGSIFAKAHRQAGNYIGRILKGEKPGDLPLIFVRKV
jgi:putative ABC transport system substrate-binding protein